MSQLSEETSHMMVRSLTRYYQVGGSLMVAPALINSSFGTGAAEICLLVLRMKSESFSLALDRDMTF